MFNKVLTYLLTSELQITRYCEI